ncbi:MAG: 3'-5' exonuclease [Myxococcota bacterium]
MREVRDILGRLAIVDVETTGLDPHSAHVIEVGVLFVTPGDAPARKRWLVRPPGPVPAWITALTGLDEADVSGAPRFGEVEEELKAALSGWTVVAHNAAFERSFLGGVLAEAPMLDSCVLTHLLFPELASHALDALVRWAGVGTGAQHRALGDAEDTLRVLEVALARVISEGRRAEVEALLRRLSPAQTKDGEALVGVLTRLRDATPPTGQPPARVESCADRRLSRLLLRGLGSGEPMALEIERPGAVAAALDVASRGWPRVAAFDGRAQDAVATGGVVETPARGAPAAVSNAEIGRHGSGVETAGALRSPAAGGVATGAHGGGDDGEALPQPGQPRRTPPPPRLSPPTDEGVPLVLAVPRRTLRELAPSSPVPVVQRRPTCRVRLRALLEETPLSELDDAARLARAYLTALLARGPLLVPSSWLVARAPEVAALLRAAGPCRCGDRACGGVLPDHREPAVLVSHELALDWLEQRVPMALVVLDAEKLPAAERARTSIRLDAERLVRERARVTGSGADARALRERLDGGAEALTDALQGLAGQVGLTIDLRVRALGPWLRVRDVLTGLRKDVAAFLAGDTERGATLTELADDLARLAEPPPPGFDVRVLGGDAPVLFLEPRRPEVALAARLPKSAVLVTGSRGGVDWAHLATRHVGPLAHPTVELEPCVASAIAVATHAARLALQLAGPVSVLVEGPLESLAEAIRDGFPRLPVRTVPGAPPPGGPCVTLVRWPGHSPPDALATLIGPVRDVRRAVLACGARDVTVLTPAERWDEVEARLEDLRDDGGGLRLGAPPELLDDAR